MLYKLTILLTAMISGFMLSYCITLGSYFNFLLEQKKDDGFSNFYSPFRRKKKAVFWYGVACSVQIISAVLSFFFSSQQLFPKIAALIPFLILFLCHWLTGMEKSEEQINSGLPIDEDNRSIYLKWNIPLHFVYFLVFSCSALIQLFYL